MFTMDNFIELSVVPEVKDRWLSFCRIIYTVSNVILVEEKLTALYHYLRYCHKGGTIVLSIPSAMI